MSQLQNPDAIYSTPEITHRVELILHLLEYSHDLVIVKGEHASGKTTLLAELLKKQETNLLLKRFEIHGRFNINEIYRTLISGSDVAEAEYSQEDLAVWLSRCQSKQTIPVLLLDNVDLLNDEQLQEVFALLAFSNQAHTLHACLFCEPVFMNRIDEIMETDDDSQRLHVIEMPPLTEQQTTQYIQARFPAVENSVLQYFDEKTIKQIHRISHGLPGRINTLCEQYLDDPAVNVDKKQTENTPVRLDFFVKNKLIIMGVLLLTGLSIGVTALLYQTENKQHKKTMKIALPDQQAQTRAVKPVDAISSERPSEPEAVTIEALLPPVISEIPNDLNNPSEVVVYSAAGEPVMNEVITPAVDEAPIDTMAEPALSIQTAEDKNVSGQHDIEWLKKQDPSNYVLQLIGAHEKKTIDVYLQAFTDNTEEIISFSAINNGKEWHVLIYGLFPGRDAAVRAIKELPAEARAMSPWPRTVASIKEIVH